MTRHADSIKSLSDGESWVLKNLPNFNKPGLILLSGPMGAGKTQVTRWILEALGSSEASSPTYSIHQRYNVAAKIIDHFDLYRLESDLDLESSGFWDTLADRDNIVIVEWADRLPESAFPKSRAKFHLQIDLKDGERTFTSWSH
jgi:tRNA threonylcarbamoyladenosine biosynthesis protein TsaE